MEYRPIETKGNQRRKKEEEIKRNKIRNIRKLPTCEMHFILNNG